MADETEKVLRALIRSLLERLTAFSLQSIHLSSYIFS